MRDAKDDAEYPLGENSSDSPDPAAARSVSKADTPLFTGLFDSNGLRPIWRLLLYAAMAWVLYAILGWGLRFVEDRNLNQLWLDLLSESILLISAFVPAFILSRPEGRSLGDYGLSRSRVSGKLFCVGGLWGIAAISILMFTLDRAGAFSFGVLALHGYRIAEFAVFWAAFFLIVAFAEEFLLRGYTQFTLTQAVGFWPAAVLLSIAFGAIHLLNPGEAWTGSLAAVAIGLFFCLTLRRTGSLWFAIGFHAAWDWGESYLYSVPDSGQIAPRHLLKSLLHGHNWLTGGSVGPEGSLLIFVVLILLWLVFDRIYPRSEYGLYL